MPKQRYESVNIITFFNQILPLAALLPFQNYDLLCTKSTADVTFNLIGFSSIFKAGSKPNSFFSSVCDI